MSQSSMVNNIKPRISKKKPVKLKKVEMWQQYLENLRKSSKARKERLAYQQSKIFENFK